MRHCELTPLQGSNASRDVIKHTKRGLASLTAGLLVSLLFTGCLKGLGQQSVASAANALRQLHSQWLEAGRPEKFDPKDYVTSNFADYFVYTNQILYSGATYHCRFAACVHKFPTGIVAITDEKKPCG